MSALLRQFATGHTPERAAFDRRYPRLITSDHVDLIVAESGGPEVVEPALLLLDPTSAFAVARERYGETLPGAVVGPEWE